MDSLIDPLLPDLDFRVATAGALAREVGRDALAFRLASGLETLEVKTKGLQDFVTIADWRAENTIRRSLQEAFPDDGFVGEETGGAPSDGGYWVVDPIDGTTNYLRGLRHWAVSIAYVAAGAVQVGAIFDAAADRVYTAKRGGGAFCDGVPVRASELADPAAAFAIVGYSPRTDFADYQAMTRRLHELGMDYRRLGSAALGLVRVAGGIADLYYERHLNAWDVLAGTLIAEEAGAAVSMPALPEMMAHGGAVLASCPGLTEQLRFLR